MGNLYEGLDEFKLIDVDEVVLTSPNDFLIIEEPIGFDDLNIFLKRRPEDRGGVNFEFGDEESFLEFDKAAGKSLIESILDLAGGDFSIDLEYRNDGTLIYAGSLVGSSLDKEDATIGFRVKRYDFDNKLQTRFDSIINLESSTDFDDNAITPFTTRLLPFHSKAVELVEERNSNELEATSSSIMSNAFSFDQINNNDEEFFGYFIPELAVVTRSDIEEFFEYGNLVLGRNAVAINPLAGAFDATTPRQNKLFLVQETQRRVKYTVEFDIDFEINIIKAQTDAEDTFTTMEFLCQTILVVENTSDAIKSIFTLDNSTIDYFNVTKTDVINHSGSQEIETVEGDKVYFYVLINPFATGVVVNGGADFATFGVTKVEETTNIKFTALTKERPSLVEGGYFNEILDKALEFVTGNSGVLTSTFFENRVVDSVDNACGGLNFVATGNKIRGINEDLTVTIKDLLSLPLSRFGCGFAIVDDSGTDKLLLEKQSHFFQDKKIITINETYDPVTKKINKDTLFNESLIGYKKFTRPNERGTIEGFNTQSEHLFPIEKDKRKISLTSDIIADGTEIERLRRQGFQDVSDQSDEKDDDLFVVKVAEFNNTTMYDPSLYGSGDDLNIQRDATNSQIIINGLIIQGLSTNDFINIDGQTNRQISGTPILDFENNRTILPSTTETQDDIIFNKFNFRESDDSTEINTYNPERLEGFNNVTGLIDKNSEYNLDHAPTQFLIQNFSWYGGALLKKAGTKILKFLKKKNPTVLSKAYDSATCSLTTDLIVEDQDLTLTQLRSYDTEFFTEFIYEFNARLSIEEVLLIRDAMRNQAVTDINYGFIEHPDEDGNLIEAYLFDMEYNPVNEETSFITWGKNN